jgi:hypothetical protein
MCEMRLRLALQSCCKASHLEGAAMITDVYAWIKLLTLAAASVYFLRSAIFPKESDPKGRIDRTLRFIGGILFAVFFVYGVGFVLRFWGRR